MAAKRMGRNLNALLGGASRGRPAGREAPDPKGDAEPASGDVEAPEAPADLPGERSPDPASDGARKAPELRSVPKSPPTTAPSATRSATRAATSTAAPSLGDGAGSVAQTATEPDATESPRPGDRLRTIGVERIRRGAYQPRRQFDEALLAELADSIRVQGLIQPILVRERDGGFELIAGERRWRAAQLAGMHEIPAIVREMADERVAAVSLIENIQRKDLNPLEEAAAFRRLCDDFAMTHQAVAEAVGRSRVSVSNALRLLELNEGVKALIDAGSLEMGHARALLGAPRADQTALAERVVKQGLTARAVEKLVRGLRDGEGAAGEGEAKGTGSGAGEPAASADPDVERLCAKLGAVLGAPVRIRHRPDGGGRLEIAYSSVDELDGILGHIS